MKQSEKRENDNKERIRGLETEIETFKMLEKRLEQEMKIKKSLQDEVIRFTFAVYLHLGERRIKKTRLMKVVKVPGSTDTSNISFRACFMKNDGCLGQFHHVMYWKKGVSPSLIVVCPL